MNTMHALFDDVEPDLAKLDLEPKSFFYWVSLMKILIQRIWPRL
jgi:hypothetical protein